MPCASSPSIVRVPSLPSPLLKRPLTTFPALNRQRIIDIGGIECILSAMLQHPDKANLQEQGCAALYNLSLGEGMTTFCTFCVARRAQSHQYWLQRLDESRSSRMEGSQWSSAP